MTTLLSAVIKTLDDDEFINVPLSEEERESTEVFLAEPGLYRVLAQDTTPAGKNSKDGFFIRFCHPSESFKPIRHQLLNQDQK